MDIKCPQIHLNQHLNAAYVLLVRYEQASQPQKNDIISHILLPTVSEVFSISIKRCDSSQPTRRKSAVLTK